MKIYREIKSNERLPTKEGYYWTIRKVGKLRSIEYFIPNYNPELWIAANEYWLEPIEVELDSEKILPKESRYLGELTNVTDAEIDKWLQSYHEALEAAELQIIRLKEQYTICKEIADRRKEQVDLLTSDADKRYNKAKESLLNINYYRCGTKDIEKALKIAAYGTDK